MKIYNIQPIKVTEYIFNEEHLAKSATGSGYESGFSYNGRKTESLNTLAITFDIRYNVGKNEDLLLSYKSYGQFNFESEGFDADVLSITKFLNEYYTHTEAFFQQYGLKTIQEEEKRFGVDRGDSIAHLANWTSLESSDLYHRRFSAVCFEENAE